MIRRFDAPLSTHVDYRIRPAEWAAAAGWLAGIAFVVACVFAGGSALQPW